MCVVWGFTGIWDETRCEKTNGHCDPTVLLVYSSIFLNISCHRTTQEEFCVPLRQNRVTAERTRTHPCVRFGGVSVYVRMFELWLSDFWDYGIRPQMSRTDPKSNTHRRSLASRTHTHAQSLPGQAVSAESYTETALQSYCHSKRHIQSLLRLGPWSS